MLLPKGAAVVVAGVEIVVAGHQELGARKVSEELQPAAEEAQRVAHIASQHEDIRLLRGGPLGEGQVGCPGCRLVVEVGRDQDAHKDHYSKVLRAHQIPEYAENPPSTATTMPVTKRAAALASQMAAPTNSSGAP